MNKQEFIEKGIQGGYQLKAQDWYWSKIEDAKKIYRDSIFLDPELFKAVGKVEGKSGGEGASAWVTMVSGYEWHVYQMHRMIDALADGKTIEQYLETL